MENRIATLTAENNELRAKLALVTKNETVLEAQIKELEAELLEYREKEAKEIAAAEEQENLEPLNNRGVGIVNILFLIKI